MQDPGQHESKEGPKDVKLHDAVQGLDLELDNTITSEFPTKRSEYIACPAYDVNTLGLKRTSLLTLSRVWRSHSFKTNPDTSSRAMRMRWTGLVFPSTAPIEMRAEAVHISATTKL